MFGWFKSKVDCPVDSVKREFLEAGWEVLEAAFGFERVRKSPLILPTEEYFPDPYSGTEDDVEAILNRVCQYMDVDPRRVKLAYFSDQRITEGPTALGTFRKKLNKFEVAIKYEVLGDPLTIVATIAHELGHIHLIGNNQISDDEMLTDLLTVFFGMGVFSANAALKETNWRSGNWSGWSVGKQGYLDMRDYGYAFAMFARTREENGSAWKNHLRLDVRSAFQQTMKLFEQEKYERDELQ